MARHNVGTQEEWEAARNELLKREQELGNLDEEIAKQPPSDAKKALDEAVKGVVRDQARAKGFEVPK